MFAAALLALAAPEPSRVVTGPVRHVSFDCLGVASGLEVELNVGDDDPRARDRRLSLYGAKLFVEGKEAALPDAARWLSTAVKADAKGEKVLGVIEVTVTVRPSRYVQIDRADFRLVHWEAYYLDPKPAK